MFCQTPIYPARKPAYGGFSHSDIIPLRGINSELSEFTFPAVDRSPPFSCLPTRSRTILHALFASRLARVSEQTPSRFRMNAHRDGGAKAAVGLPNQTTYPIPGFRG